MFIFLYDESFKKSLFFNLFYKAEHSVKIPVLIFAAGFRKARIRVVFIKKLNNMEPALIDVEMNVPGLEIRSTGLPDFCLRVEPLNLLHKKCSATKGLFAFHSELTRHLIQQAALRALKLYDFDTVMFPLNWHMHMEHGMGERIRRAVKDKGLGLLGIKSMVDRAWSHEEQDSSKYIKSWYRPFDIETESSYLMAALKYSISLGADILRATALH